MPPPNVDFRLGNNILAALPLLIAINLASVVFAWIEDISEAKQSVNWPTVQGIVTESKPLQNCGKGKNRDLFYPAIKYSYFVDGQSYDGYQIAIGPTDCGTQDTIKKIIAPYPLGKTVTIWYKPQNPQESILQAGKVTDSTWPNIYSTSLTVVGFVLLAWWLVYIGRKNSRIIKQVK